MTGPGDRTDHPHTRTLDPEDARDPMKEPREHHDADMKAPGQELPVGEITEETMPPESHELGPRWTMSVIIQMTMIGVVLFAGFLALLFYAVGLMWPGMIWGLLVATVIGAGVAAVVSWRVWPRRTVNAVTRTGVGTAAGIAVVTAIAVMAILVEFLVQIA